LIFRDDPFGEKGVQRLDACRAGLDTAQEPIA
jgi:hypothetical protein